MSQKLIGTSKKFEEKINNSLHGIGKCYSFLTIRESHEILGFLELFIQYLYWPEGHTGIKKNIIKKYENLDSFLRDDVLPVSISNYIEKLIYDS